MPLVGDVCGQEVSEDELSHLLDYLLDFTCDEKCWDCIKSCVENIYMYIRGASEFILRRIGRCGKMKGNGYLAEYI